MSLSDIIQQLNTLLATLFDDPDDARNLAEQGGLPKEHINHADDGHNQWHNILTEAKNRGKVTEIITAAQSRYEPNEPPWNQLEQLKQAYLALPQPQDDPTTTTPPTDPPPPLPPPPPDTWLQKLKNLFPQALNKFVLPLLVTVLGALIVLWITTRTSVVPPTPSSTTSTPTSTSSPTGLQRASIVCKSNEPNEIYAGPGSAYDLVRDLLYGEEFTATAYQPYSYNVAAGKVRIPYLEITLGDDSVGWVEWTWHSIDCEGYNKLEDILPTPVSIPATPTPSPTLQMTTQPTKVTPTPVLPTPTFTPFPTVWASLQVFPIEVDRGNLVKISIDTKNAGMVELRAGPTSTVGVTYSNPEPNFKPRSIWDKPETDTDYNLIVNNLSATRTHNINESVRVNIPECKVTSQSTVFLRKGPGDGFDDEKIPLKFRTTFQPVAFRSSGYETGGENSSQPPRIWYYVTDVTLPDPIENAGLKTHEGWVGLSEFAAPDTDLFECHYLDVHSPEGQLEFKDEGPPPLICNPAGSTLELRKSPSTESDSIRTIGVTQQITPLEICNVDASKVQWILAESLDFPDRGWVAKTNDDGSELLKCPNWDYHKERLSTSSCPPADGAAPPTEGTNAPIPQTPTATATPSTTWTSPAEGTVTTPSPTPTATITPLAESTTAPIPQAPTATATPSTTATPAADGTAVAVPPTRITIGTPTATASPPAERTATPSAPPSTATISPPSESTVTAVPSTPIATGTPIATATPERPFDFTYQLVVPGHGMFGSPYFRLANYSFRLPEGYAAVGAPEVLVKQLNEMTEHDFRLSPMAEGADLFWVVENPHQETRPARVRVRIWASRH
ncbi:MAG: hypothetical protein KDI55_13250 [Anaerolineae bacterium]|nr:hypothetical protein [Anaerolineae bacterium]MCB0254682.1 hypothetical protein [Anaerolineae bacterium]